MQPNAPVDAPAPIQTSEYRERLSRVQAEMANTGLDASFITSEDNFRWLTGFNAPVWQNLTRPRYCIVPAHGDPILSLPSGNDAISNRTAAWTRDVRSWAAPNPDDDGVTLVIDALAGGAGAHRRRARLRESGHHAEPPRSCPACASIFRWCCVATARSRSG